MNDMEILEIIGVPYFKKGKGIHIKKKNRGKFTEYCGGKVTDECIKRAKKSKNPTLRKRATFADNARKWKHAEGGIIKAQLGTMFLTPHPLSPVGIAVNQAKANAKNKKDQTHLPPGVKEVIGPDGNKVAIRTEQPLKPLEQGIAEWLPGTGDIAEFGYVANDLKQGRYGTAMVGAGLLFIPGAWGKFLNKSRKTVRTADNIEDAVRKANTAEYINTIDDVVLDPYARLEVPREAFISKPNPLEAVRAQLKSSPAASREIAERELYLKFLNAINRTDVKNDFSNFNVKELRQILKNQGIEEGLLTDENLLKLIYARRLDYSNQAISDNLALRHNNNGHPRTFMYDLFRKGDPNSVGYIIAHNADEFRSVTDDIITNHVGVEYVSNTSNGRYKGVSELGYNAAIGDLGHIDSGILLLSPNRTTAVQNKYKNKILLGMFGSRPNSFENFPVYRLTSPTYNVPVKYIDKFTLDGLDPNGKFIIDFSKGPMFKFGGKLNKRKKQ